MKECSYCGRENEDTAAACAACGMDMPSSVPTVDPALIDPALALVIVRTFDTMEQASLLTARLAAAGIEACIPESGTQPFPEVIPLGSVTVRVAAKDRASAEAIATGIQGVEACSAAQSPRVDSPQSFRLLLAQLRLGLNRRAMAVISTMIVGVPIIFGVVAHSVRTTAVMGPLFWLWALFSVVCFFWGRYAFRRYRVLAWTCLAVGVVPLISFSCLFWTVDLPVNAQSQPDAPVHNNNPHNW